MTREEAIKILENEKECVKRAEYCDRQCGKCELVKEDKIILKTFDIAIEALEQEPKTGHWIMKRRTHNEVKHYTGQDEMGEIHTISVLERYEVDEPYCSECGKRAGDTSQDYCCACGAKMAESEE